MVIGLTLTTRRSPGNRVSHPYVGLLVGYAFWDRLFMVSRAFVGLHDARLAAFGMIVTAVAIALLGPGAFSLDGRLFGRREIVIPPHRVHRNRDRL